jgi:hypothetical protein
VDRRRADGCEAASTAKPSEEGLLGPSWASPCGPACGGAAIGPATAVGRSEWRKPVDTITTTLKREWFAKIVDGSKRVEYREIKRYWTKRLAAVKTPFVLVMRNGMTPPVPVVSVRIDRIVPSPRGRVRKGNYALHIGRVLKVEHWDRKGRCPK